MNNQFDRQEFAQQFSKQLEDDLTDLGRDILDKWLKDVDSDLKKLINELLDNSLSSIADALVGSGDTAFALPSGKKVASTISKLIESGIEEIFDNEKTTTSTRETDRSREANGDFKESVSQQQARAVQQVNRGKRNL